MCMCHPIRIKKERIYIKVSETNSLSTKGQKDEMEKEREKRERKFVVC